MKTKNDEVSQEEVVKEINTNKNVKSISKDKIIIASIVGSMLIIALVIFSIFLYNSTFKSVAKFDGGSLSVTDFNIYYKIFAPMLSNMGYPKELVRDEIVKKAAIDQIILMLANEKGIKLTDEEKNNVKKLLEDKTQSAQIESYGIDPKQMANYYENDYIIASYIEYLKDNLTDEEVKEYITKEYDKDANMKEYITRHVLISTIDDTTGKELSAEEKVKAKEEANKVITRLNNGEKIEDLAKELSDDTGSAKDGGLIKMYMDERLVKEYTDAVALLEVGKYTTTPVETDYGYHIIYLEKCNENGRINSDSEREAVVSGKLDKFPEDYNLKIDEKSINDVIFDITGVDLNKEDTVDVYTK